MRYARWERWLGLSIAAGLVVSACGAPSGSSDLAPHRIRVNAIVPGFFPAEQNRKLLDEARVRAILAHTPAARLGEPDELVGTMIWLASERASGFVTGALVRVDGGFGAMTI